MITELNVERRRARQQIDQITAGKYAEFIDSWDRSQKSSRLKGLRDDPSLPKDRMVFRLDRTSSMPLVNRPRPIPLLLTHSWLCPEHEANISSFTTDLPPETSTQHGED